MRRFSVMDSGNPASHSITVESVSSAVVDVCRRVLPAVEAEDFSNEDIFSVRLALEEAFINAIKHGNKMDPHKQVKVEYSIDSEKVEISLTDQGGGFDPNVVPDPRLGENLYKAEGRGLLLMQSYMDVVEFNKQGNSVRMVRFKEKPSFTIPQGSI